MKRIPIVLAAVLVLLMSTSLRAEYAVVTVNTKYQQIIISITGADMSIRPISKEDFINGADPAGGVKEVKKMTEEGWQVSNTSSSAVPGSSDMVYVFVLKRK